MTELVCAVINEEYSRPSLYITQHINTIYIIMDSKINILTSLMTQILKLQPQHLTYIEW